MHHLKELYFTFITILISFNCTVTFNIGHSIHCTTDLFSFYRIIILFESE